jgi:tetratricopeptide (TPR) repeat protein
VELDPQQVNAHYTLASIYEKEGKTNEAIEEYSIVGELVPEASDVQYKLGTLYDKAGRKDEAFRAYQKSGPYLQRLGIGTGK